MGDKRKKRAKLNIIFSLLKQFVTLVCGLIVPKLMLSTFGSEVYGATASIAQFLAYITLLEGGIGGVTRAALYEPLANKDMETVSVIMAEVQKFFRIVGYIFAGYVIVLACSFKHIAHLTALSWTASFVLVLVISISSFAQYFIGISYAVLIQSAQKVYVTDTIALCATIANTVLTVICIRLGFDIIAVKLVSSMVFVVRPVIMLLYVKSHFSLKTVKNPKTNYLSQKWTGLGQHIAYFIHTNTDVVVLTALANLNLVAVYAVYNMVVSQIQNITTAFTSGAESLLGNMLAKKEQDLVNKTFNTYETMVSIVSTILFGTTFVMIVPFVRLYTVGISDTNYIHPLFSILLICASVLFCWRLPYHALVLAKGHYKETKIGAYFSCNSMGVDWCCYRYNCWYPVSLIVLCGISIKAHYQS